MWILLCHWTWFWIKSFLNSTWFKFFLIIFFHIFLGFLALSNSSFHPLITSPHWSIWRWWSLQYKLFVAQTTMILPSRDDWLFWWSITQTGPVKEQDPSPNSISSLIYWDLKSLRIVIGFWIYIWSRLLGCLFPLCWLIRYFFTTARIKIFRIFDKYRCNYFNPIEFHWDYWNLARFVCE